MTDEAPARRNSTSGRTCLRGLLPRLRSCGVWHLIHLPRRDYSLFGSTVQLPQNTAPRREGVGRANTGVPSRPWSQKGSSVFGQVYHRLPALPSLVRLAIEDGRLDTRGGGKAARC